MRADSLDRLLDLMEEERSLLMSGDIEALADLEPRKTAMLEAFSAEDHLDENRLATLQTKLHRNQALLDAARKGLNAAGARLRDIRKAMLQLDTYTRNGDIRNLQQARPKIERRA